MSFNSYLFVLIFFPISIIGYHILNKKNHFELGKWFLLVMSLIFYCYSGIKGIITISILIAVNYGVYRLIRSNKSPKLFAGLGVIINIFSLFIFKYFVTVEIKANQLFGTSFTFNDIVVPLGISFITFSQISFLVDAYKELDCSDGKVLNDISFSDYALYVLFFPKVSVGPIALAKDFIPQFNDALRKEVNWDNLAKGLYAFSFGLAKKVLVADVLAKYANWGFSVTHIDGMGSINAFIVMLAYTMQIYFDFSGFCDMSMGICYMLNFDLPLNFNSPYRSLSIGEFWDRWHITLTKFFTKYLYIPLGGSRKGVVRTYLNILIVFIVSGIWHGAAFTFVIWGLLHGIASCIGRGLKKYEEKVPRIIRWAFTFLFVNIAWVFFRAVTLSDALNILKELFSFSFKPVDIELIAAATPAEYEIFQWIFGNIGLNTYYTGLPVTIIFLIFAIFASIKMKNTSERVSEFDASSKTIVITILLLVWSIVSLSEVSSFIYVNF